MTEATEGCDINQGRYATRVKSTKFVKQILSTYTRIFAISGFVKQSTACSQNKKTIAKSSQSSDDREILRAKRQGGGG
jgi:hypothetical protein